MSIHSTSQTDVRSGVDTHRQKRLDPPVAAILDALGMAVLVVDENRVVAYRNSLATAWLQEGDRLDDTMEAVHFLGPFEGWPREIEKTLGSTEPQRYPCALSCEKPSSPRMLELRCQAMPETKPGLARRVLVFLQPRREPLTDVDAGEISQRLASLGRLASRVAHELNNPLDGILRYVNLAIRLVGTHHEPRLEPKLMAYLSESRTGLLRMVQIIGDLLEYSRSSGGRFDEASVNDVVEQAIKSVSHSTGASAVIISADFQTQEMPCANGSRLFQVCCNLIKNALDAMPDGGRIAITTGVVGHEVVIRVADTGVGLPDPPDRVFEPFYTTKPPGQGTGLGLAICKDFVEGMGGRIGAAAGEEGGTVFTVRLPFAGDRSSTGSQTSSGSADVPAAANLEDTLPESDA